MPLGHDQVKRYARHVILPEVGGAGQERLLAAAVRVDSASGAGAVAIVYLAAAGVGTLVVTDGTRVVGPDLLFEAADVGRPRLDAVRERVAALNPDVRVVADGDAAHVLPTLSAADPIEALASGAAAAAHLVRTIGERR